jgi:endonuclease-3
LKRKPYDQLLKIKKFIENTYRKPVLGKYHRKPFEVLIATVISQRTKDETTEKILKKLFKKYNTPFKLSKAKLSEIKKNIRGSGFYNQKAKAIKEISSILIKKYKGKVPSDMDELLNFPKVGRKTASCVLVYGFNKNAIPVDTHVHRISNLLQWVNTKNPEQTEIELKKMFPKNLWILLNETLVKFGKNVCLPYPTKKKCKICPIQKTCPYLLKNL